MANLQREELKAVCKVIKFRFGNMTVVEVVDFASDILEALDSLKETDNERKPGH